MCVCTWARERARVSCVGVCKCVHVALTDVGVSVTWDPPGQSAPRGQDSFSVSFSVSLVPSLGSGT